MEIFLGVAFYGLLFLVLFGSVFGVLIFKIARMSQASGAWRAFARERNLEFVPGGTFGHDAIRGNLDGLPFTINTITVGAGRSSRTYTQWHIEIPEWMPAGMALRREQFGSGLAKLFGAQDIQIGDPEIDAALMIEGSDPTAIRNLVLDPQVRPLLLHLCSAFEQFSIGSMVRLQRLGIEADPRVLEGSLRQAAGLSFALARAVREQRSGQRPAHAPAAQPTSIPSTPHANLAGSDPVYAGVSVQERGGYGASGGSPFRSNARPADLLPLPPALAPFARKELGPTDRERLLQQASGCWHVIEMHVHHVAPTVANEVPQGWAGGCTLVGVAAEGLDVAVSFPVSHAAHIRGVEPGMSIRTQAGLISWDAKSRLLRLGAV